MFRQLYADFNEYTEGDKLVIKGYINSNDQLIVKHIRLPKVNKFKSPSLSIYDWRPVGLNDDGVKVLDGSLLQLELLTQFGEERADMLQHRARTLSKYIEEISPLIKGVLVIDKKGNYERI